MNTYDYIGAVRWLPVLNVSGQDIPQCSVLEVVGFDPYIGYYEVTQPTRDGGHGHMFSGLAIIVKGGRGQATFDLPWWVTYDTNGGADAPIAGDVWSAKKNSWALGKANATRESLPGYRVMAQPRGRIQLSGTFGPSLTDPITLPVVDASPYNVTDLITVRDSNGSETATVTATTISAITLKALKNAYTNPVVEPAYYGTVQIDIDRQKFAVLRCDTTQRPDGTYAAWLRGFCDFPIKKSVATGDTTIQLRDSTDGFKNGDTALLYGANTRENSAITADSSGNSVLVSPAGSPYTAPAGSLRTGFPMDIPKANRVLARFPRFQLPPRNGIDCLGLLCDQLPAQSLQASNSPGVGATTLNVNDVSQVLVNDAAVIVDSINTSLSEPQTILAINQSVLTIGPLVNSYTTPMVRIARRDVFLIVAGAANLIVAESDGNPVLYGIGDIVFADSDFNVLGYGPGAALVNTNGFTDAVPVVTSVSCSGGQLTVTVQNFNFVDGLLKGIDLPTTPPSVQTITAYCCNGQLSLVAGTGPAPPGLTCTQIGQIVAPYTPDQFVAWIQTVTNLCSPPSVAPPTPTPAPSPIPAPSPSPLPSGWQGMIQLINLYGG